MGKFSFLFTVVFSVAVAVPGPAQGRVASPKTIKPQIVLLYGAAPKTDPKKFGQKVLADSFSTRIQLHSGGKVSPGINVALVDQSGSYKSPPRELLWRGRRGLYLLDVEAALAPEAVLSIYFAVVEAKSDYRYLNTINDYVYFVAKGAGAYIWDVEAEELFSPESWKETRMDKGKDPASIMRANVAVHQTKPADPRVRGSKDGWLIQETRGMGKFGQPDFWISLYPSAYQQSRTAVYSIAEAMATMSPWKMPEQLDGKTIPAKKGAVPPDIMFKQGTPPNLPDSKAAYGIDPTDQIAFNLISGQSTEVNPPPPGADDPIPATLARSILKVDRGIMQALVDGGEIFYEARSDGEKTFWYSENYSFAKRGGQEVLVYQNDGFFFDDGSRDIETYEFSTTPPFRLMAASAESFDSEGNSQKLEITKSARGDTHYKVKLGSKTSALEKLDYVFADDFIANRAWSKLTPEDGEELTFFAINFRMAKEGGEPPIDLRRGKFTGSGATDVLGRKNQSTNFSLLTPGSHFNFSTDTNGRMISALNVTRITRLTFTRAPKSQATAKPK